MGLTRVVIKYDFSSIPKNASIISASIAINFFGQFQGSGEALAFKVTTQWSETATPDWKKGWKKPAGDFDSSKSEGRASVRGTGWCTINLNPATIQGFINNPSTNYGYILIPKGGPNVDRFGGQIYLSEAGYSMAWGSSATAMYAPKLTITYQSNTEINEQKQKFTNGENLRIVQRSGFLQIEGMHENLINTINIYSLHGKMIKQYKPSAMPGNIAIPFTTKGVFTVTIVSQNSTWNKKIVIK